MALSDTRTKVVYKPDGTEVRYDIPFPLFDAQDVECIEVDEYGRQINISAFSIQGVGGESGSWVIFDIAPDAGTTLVIKRNTRPVHETEYPEGGAFPSRSVERDLSRITAMIQELNEVVARAIKVNAGEQNASESAEDLHLRIQLIATAASDAVRQAEAGAEAAASAAVLSGKSAIAAHESGAKAAAAAEAASEMLTLLTDLDMRVVAIDCHEAPYGEYDAQSGTLELYLPFCQNGEYGSIFLSDAQQGDRKAAEGVGASEWALGQVAEKTIGASNMALAAQDTALGAQNTARAALAATDALKQSLDDIKARACAVFVYPGAFHTFYEQSPPPGWAVRNGALLENADEGFSDLWAALQLPQNAWKVKSGTEWQALSDKSPWQGIGGVPFFALDKTAKTIRLPDTRGMYVEDAGFDGLGVGDVHGDAIRNFTGTIGANTADGVATKASGVFALADGQTRRSGEGTDIIRPVRFDPSMVIPTANKNQPRAFGALPCVYVGGAL